MTDCEDLYNARIRAALEGDYSTWASLFSPVDLGATDFPWIIIVDNNGVTEAGISGTVIYLSISGAITTISDIEEEAVWDADTVMNPVRSILFKYRLSRYTCSKVVHVYKDYVDTYTITPSWTNPVNGYNLAAISPDGHYIVVVWKETSDSHVYVQAFVGS